MAVVESVGCNKFGLFHLFSNILRLLYHQPSDAITHGGFLFHLITATDGVLVVDNELLALANASLLPAQTLRSNHITLALLAGSVALNVRCPLTTNMIMLFVIVGQNRGLESRGGKAN